MDSIANMPGFSRGGKSCFSSLFVLINRRLPVKLTKGQQEEKGDSYCTQGSRKEVAAALHGYS